MLPQINTARDLYRRLCNIELVYTGACVAPFEAPSEALTVGCDAGGFFGDWWLAGSFNELATSTCKFGDGWRRVVGLGAEIVVIPVVNVTPDTATRLTVGCSFASTHNYVVVEPGSGPAVAAHEIGHACWLPHDGSTANLIDAEQHRTQPDAHESADRRRAVEQALRVLLGGTMSVSESPNDQVEQGEPRRLESCNVSLRLPVVLSAATTVVLVAVAIVIWRLLL